MSVIYLQCFLELLVWSLSSSNFPSSSGQWSSEVKPRRLHVCMALQMSRLVGLSWEVPSWYRGCWGGMQRAPEGFFLGEVRPIFPSLAGQLQGLRAVRMDISQVGCAARGLGLSEPPRSTFPPPACWRKAAAGQRHLRAADGGRLQRASRKME